MKIDKKKIGLIVLSILVLSTIYHFLPRKFLMVKDNGFQLESDNYKTKISTENKSFQFKGKLLSYDIGEFNNSNCIILLNDKGIIEIIDINGDVLFHRDLKKIKPWKVRIGNINNDGVNEILIGIEKTTPLDKTVRKRCFIYNVDFKNNNLIPRYRASRFVYDMVDFDIEKTPEGDVLIGYEKSGDIYYKCKYKWTGFGFELVDKYEVEDHQ